MANHAGYKSSMMEPRVVCSGAPLDRTRNFGQQKLELKLFKLTLGLFAAKPSPTSVVFHFRGLDGPASDALSTSLPPSLFFPPLFQLLLSLLLCLPFLLHFSSVPPPPSKSFPAPLPPYCVFFTHLSVNNQYVSCKERC